MTVAELMSVLGELDPTDVVCIGLSFPHSADIEYRPAADSVYAAVVDINGEPHNAVVIDA
jgi:hypothetical protein